MSVHPRALVRRELLDLTHLTVWNTENDNCECPICKETYLIGRSILRVLPCMHSAHQICIDEWFSRSPIVKCPICCQEWTDGGLSSCSSTSSYSSVGLSASSPNLIDRFQRGDWPGLTGARAEHDLLESTVFPNDTLSPNVTPPLTGPNTTAGSPNVPSSCTPSPALPEEASVIIQAMRMARGMENAAVANLKRSESGQKIPCAAVTPTIPSAAVPATIPSAAVPGRVPSAPVVDNRPSGLLRKHASGFLPVLQEGMIPFSVIRSNKRITNQVHH